MVDGADPGSVTHVFADGPDSHVITATAVTTPATGSQVYTSNSVSVTINNVAPTITVDAASHAPRNTMYPLSLTIEDPGDDHVLSWTVNWGDGSDPDGDGVVGQTIYYGLSASHNYASTGSFDISITVTDEDATYSVPVHQLSTHIEAPTGPQIVPISPTQLDLRWTDNSDDEVGFIIERQLNGGSWIEVHRTGSDVTRWSDVDVEEENDYSYRVSTNDGSGIPGGAGGSGVPDGGGKPGRLQDQQPQSGAAPY